MSSHFLTIIVDGGFPYLNKLCMTLEWRKRELNAEQICSYKKNLSRKYNVMCEMLTENISTAFLIWYILLHQDKNIFLM